MVTHVAADLFGLGVIFRIRPESNRRRRASSDRPTGWRFGWSWRSCHHARDLVLEKTTTRAKLSSIAHLSAHFVCSFLWNLFSFFSPLVWRYQRSFAPAILLKEGKREGRFPAKSGRTIRFAHPNLRALISLAHQLSTTLLRLCLRRGKSLAGLGSSTATRSLSTKSKFGLPESMPLNWTSHGVKRQNGRWCVSARVKISARNSPERRRTTAWLAPATSLTVGTSALKSSKPDWPLMAGTILRVGIGISKTQRCERS